MDVVDASTGEIVVDEQAHGLILRADGFRFTPTGLIVEGEPSFELWQAVGVKLQAMKNAIQWWIGDWLNYGERRWGEMYAQAVEQTSYTEGSLANMKWVADSVQPSSRNENLSYSHHVAVAPLPPVAQEQWLAEAEIQGLTTRQLQRAIRRPQSTADRDGLMRGQIDNASLTVTLWPRSQEEIGEIMDRLARLVEWK
jgi:hypothetical protein